MPVAASGEEQPSARLTYDSLRRATLDPDDFTGGFGVWSGTSFSAPILAAQLAQALVDEGRLTDTTHRGAVERGWSALHRELGWTP